MGIDGVEVFEGKVEFPNSSQLPAVGPWASDYNHYSLQLRNTGHVIIKNRHQGCKELSATNLENLELQLS